MIEKSFSNQPKQLCPLQSLYTKIFFFRLSIHIPFFNLPSLPLLHYGWKVIQYNLKDVAIFNAENPFSLILLLSARVENNGVKLYIMILISNVIIENSNCCSKSNQFISDHWLLCLFYWLKYKIYWFKQTDKRISIPIKSLCMV